MHPKHIEIPEGTSYIVVCKQCNKLVCTNELITRTLTTNESEHIAWVGVKCAEGHYIKFERVDHEALLNGNYIVMH